VDSYADFRCRDGGYLYWTRYFGEIPKRTIAKFGMKKLETWGYFPLADSMALSSAVLESLNSESPIFRLFGAQTSGRISEMGEPLFTMFQDMIDQSPTQNKFMLWFWKNAPFWNDGHPIGPGIDKNGSNGSKFCGF